MQITGQALLTRLRALRERYRLNPPGQFDNTLPTPQVVRIVCSDGLVEEWIGSIHNLVSRHQRSPSTWRARAAYAVVKSGESRTQRRSYGI